MLKAPKGTRDILPAEIAKWQYAERLFLNIAKRYGYNEIRIPVFESTDVFQRGVGDTTDIVQKEMYTFNDKGGRSITLRPEGTAGVVRSYIENGMGSLPSPVKLAYNITCYRYENVQKGRYREFHQFGLESFGCSSPEIDAEIISLLYTFFRELGLKKISLNLNSIGCPTCRKKYNELLKGYLEPNLANMCDTCRDRFDRNPLRIIDCKEDRCREYVKGAPALIDNLCDECQEHFDKLTSILDELDIPFVINKGIVRGLDYYTKTVFEFVSENVGTQGTICGGGRYDNLISEFGGQPTPGIGFALGVERLMMEIEAQGIELPVQENLQLYIVNIGDKANSFARKLILKLREKGIRVEKDLLGRAMKAQMKAANRLKADNVLVLGDDEVDNLTAKIRNMQSGETVDVSLNGIDEIINNL